MQMRQKSVQADLAESCCAMSYYKDALLRSATSRRCRLECVAGCIVACQENVIEV